jgi:type IV secretory pathway VirB3-like protein
MTITLCESKVEMAYIIIQVLNHTILFPLITIQTFWERKIVTMNDLRLFKNSWNKAEVLIKKLRSNCLG